jgi:hypothetical protein
MGNQENYYYYSNQINLFITSHSHFIFDLVEYIICNFVTCNSNLVHNFRRNIKEQKLKYAKENVITKQS